MLVWEHDMTLNVRLNIKVNVREMERKKFISKKSFEFCSHIA